MADDGMELTDDDFSTFEPKELFGYSYGYKDGQAAARAELAAANTRIAELEDYVHGVAGGALVEEAEQSVRRIHAEVERDMARQALTSADAMNRWWDEINAERDRLNTENAALSARLERVRALADEWDRNVKAMLRGGGGILSATVRDVEQRLRAALGEDA